MYDQYGRLMSEVDASGNTLRSYAYLHGKLAMHFESAGTAEDGDYEVLTDHLGTPLMMSADPATSPNAEGGQEMALSPFGEVTAMIGGGNNFRFPGQYYDSESGLHYNYYRDYDPGLGRYIQADPIGVDGEIPVYGYAGNDPVDLLDRKGLNPQGMFPDKPRLPCLTCITGNRDAEQVLRAVHSDTVDCLTCIAECVGKFAFKVAGGELMVYMAQKELEKKAMIKVARALGKFSKVTVPLDFADSGVCAVKCYRE